MSSTAMGMTKDGNVVIWDSICYFPQKINASYLEALFQ